MQLSENLAFTPQVLFAWNDETMRFQLLTAEISVQVLV